MFNFVFNLIRGWIIFVICFVVLAVLIQLCTVQSKGPTSYESPKSRVQRNYSYEVPFSATTTKDEFDSLGIEFIFWTGTKKNLIDTLSHIGIDIPAWPKTREEWDCLYPKIHQSFWSPRVFMLYPDDYFIWNGNRTAVFTSAKRDYPTSKILLIGDKESYDDRGKYMFFTKEMYILVF